MTSGEAGPSDDEAIRRVRAGDVDAFRILVERYQGRIHRLALRVLRNEEAARDATQEAFLKAYGALDRFQGRSGFYTWLYRLAMNQCIDHRRKDRSAREVEWEEGGAVEAETTREAEPEVAGVAFEPAAELMRGELRRHIGEAMARLPETARETLLLREVDGLSYAEIAQTQGIPKGTVMSRLHYARRQLQALLREAGVPVPGVARAAGEEAG